MNSTKIRIGYFADGPWSHAALDLLAADNQLQICFICARFKHPDPILREKAESLGIDFFISKNVNSPEFLKSIDRYKCDLIVSMSFNQILREDFLARPRLGTINCHAGKLPFYRGRNILNWVLIMTKTNLA